MKNSFKAAVLVCCVALPTQSSCLHAQGISVSVVLTPAQARTFDGALNALALQGHVAIFAEGVPLKSELSAGIAQNLTKLRSFDEALRILADGADYDVVKTDGVILLQKRYTKPDDLPGVTLEECALAMGEIDRLIDSYRTSVGLPANITSDQAIVSLAASLSAEQSHSLQDGKLALASLRTEQQAKIQVFVLDAYLPAGQISTVSAALRQAPNTSFRRTSDPNVGAGFGYDFVRFDGVKFVTSLTTPRGNFVDRAAFEALLASLPAMRQKAARVPPTLGDAVAAWSKPDKKLSADPALSGKPLTVAGAEFATPSQRMKAVAALYGLRVQTLDSGELRLSRPNPRFFGTLTALPEDIRRALPLPLLRACHDSVLVPPTHAKPSVDWETMVSRADAQAKTTVSETLQPLNDATLRCLLSELKPRLDKPNSDGVVPVSSLSQSSKNALAVQLMITMLNEIENRLRHSLPPMLTHYNELYLSGGIYKPENGSEKKFSLNLGYYNANGSFMPTSGISNLSLHP